MARKSSNVTTTSGSEKIPDVVETAKEEVKEETKEVEKTSKKSKEINDDDVVKILNPICAGRKVFTVDNKNPIIFDDKGIAEVNGKEAKRLLTIPGYSLA